jgi:hypothetical protein
LISELVKVFLDYQPFILFLHSLSRSQNLERLLMSLLGSDDFIHSLYGLLKGDGMIGFQLANRPNRALDHVQVFALEELFRQFEKAGFQSILNYAEAHAEKAWRFITALKSNNGRFNWFLNEAEMNLLIRKRIVPFHNGEIPLKYFDGSTMMTYRYPDRITENIYCQHTSESCQGGGHGIDPKILNAPVARSLEVRVSQVGDLAGRGVYATADIPNGTFIGLEESLEALYISPATYSVIDESSATFSGLVRYWDVLLYGYIHGYGWMLDDAMRVRYYTKLYSLFALFA